MEFEEIEKILKEKGFFGFTVKREEAKLAYTFRSTSHFCVEIETTVIKLNPNTFGSKKLVVNVAINGNNIEDPKELMTALDNLNAIHRKAFVKTFKQV